MHITFIYTYKELIDSGWQKLLQTSDSASIFQSPACYQFYESLSFMSPFVFGVKEDDVLSGVIVGYIQQEQKPVVGYLSRRAIIPGGVMLRKGVSDEAIEVLLTGCYNALRRKAIYIEMRNYNDYSNYTSVFRSSGFNYFAHLNFKVDTTDRQQVQQRLRDRKIVV